ncbi:MAG: pilus assembly protein N-terminal domain-containing protein [Bryobacteraceae bacterium]
MRLLISALVFSAVMNAQAPPVQQLGQRQGGDNAPMHSPADLTLTVNKSFVLEHAAGIRRISIANGDIADAVAVTTSELLLNGKSPGDTSLILWDPRGNRSAFDVHVLADSAKIDAVRAELLKETGPGISLTVEGSSVFLRGTAADTITADRAYEIASTVGKVVNLLRVSVPASEPQILLKVRFADVDRQAASQLGINLFGTNALKGIGNITTGQFPSNPTLQLTPEQGTGTTLTQFLNIFFYRPDINLGAVIQALETKNLLQILAEPNLLATSGRPASFLAGGEFPFPTLQGGGSGVGQITIQFKEFGIRLNFVPTVTPRGTIHLMVTPEVSSLDYSNGLTVSGYTVPGLATRRVQTEVELEDGQSFVIAGLLNNQVIETLNKIPGLASIPLLGKLFESRSLQKNNTELLVMVTPELVRPIPVGMKPPGVNMPLPFLKGTAQTAPQNPGPSVTGPAPVLLKQESLPIEEIKNQMQTGGSTSNTLPAAQPMATGAGSQTAPLTPNN